MVIPAVISAKEADEGVLRWERWLEEWFPIACLCREDLRGTEMKGGAGPGKEEVVWQVQIRHGRHGRVHVTGDALALDPGEFVEVVRTLERKNWYGALDQFLRIRISRSGTIGTVE